MGVHYWRKYCLYLLVILLLSILVVNIALTVWILRVAWLNMEGMGLLRITRDGVRLEGESNFLCPIFAQEIQSKEDSLFIHSTQNVTISTCKGESHISGSLTLGPHIIEILGQHLEIMASNGDLLFSADETHAVVGAERLILTGSEGALFEHSIQTSLVNAKAFKDLRLESPTRSLSLDAPKGIQIKALTGNIEATSNMDIRMDTMDGMLILDAETIRTPRLPMGKGEEKGSLQGLYEVCVCPDGKLYVSKAGFGSTCLENNEEC